MDFLEIRGQPEEVSPYMKTKWDPVVKKVVPISLAPPVGSGDPSAIAYTQDVPTRERGRGDLVLTFETAAITLDSHEVLGALKWGYKFTDKPETPVEIIGGKPDDFSLEVSPDFKALAAKWNEVGASFMYPIKIMPPDTSTVNCGGTSALPPEKK